MKLELSELHQLVSTCQRCGLCQGRKKAVPGEGPANPKLMFIGEGPGFYEDQQGRPFVGPSGKFLEELLSKINLDRSEVYITNIVKCRPPDNRDPLPEEIKACKSWLDDQIDLLKPSIIITLGRHSMSRFFPNQIISKIHGTFKNIDGLIVFAMYHPAAALHQRRLRSTLMEDIEKIPAVLAQQDQLSPEEPKPKQLSMF